MNWGMPRPQTAAEHEARRRLWNPGRLVRLDTWQIGKIASQSGAIVCDWKRTEQLKELAECWHCADPLRQNEREAQTRESLWLMGINRSTSDPGHIYFIHAPELKRVKIGFTRDVQKRFTSLRNASPCDLVLLGSVRGVPAMEYAFHQFLQRFRRYGEWFDLEEEVVVCLRAVPHYGEEGVSWAR